MIKLKLVSDNRRPDECSFETEIQAIIRRDFMVAAAKGILKDLEQFDDVTISDIDSNWPRLEQ